MLKRLNLLEFDPKDYYYPNWDYSLDLLATNYYPGKGEDPPQGPLLPGELPRVF